MSLSMPVKISVVAAVALLGLSWKFASGLEAWFNQQDAAASAESRQEAIEEAKSHREKWPADLPKAGTPVSITSPYGDFNIPIGNVGGRQLFSSSDPKSAFKPEGPNKWSSFSFLFWMPDGGPVFTNASRQPSYVLTDPDTLKMVRSPFRPKEYGHADPGPDTYVVVIAEACALDGKQAEGGVHPSDMTGSGFDYGAAALQGCKPGEVSADFTKESTKGEVTIGDDKATFVTYCKLSVETCFAWLNYPQRNMKLLAYMPKDAVGQAPKITLAALKYLDSWRVAH